MIDWFESNDVIHNNKVMKGKEKEREKDCHRNSYLKD